MLYGKLDGGISNPNLYSLKEAEEVRYGYLNDIVSSTGKRYRSVKIVKIRVTHEVIAEVIV